MWGIRYPGVKRGMPQEWPHLPPSSTFGRSWTLGGLGIPAPFTDNKTLQYFYFTNILPRTDNRTKYYWEQMLEQHKKLTPEELPARGPVIKETRKKKCRVGGGTTTTEHVSCALCENKSLFCVLEDIWWLCARCTALECNNLGSISKINFKKVSVKVKKIMTDTI